MAKRPSLVVVLLVLLPLLLTLLGSPCVVDAAKRGSSKRYRRNNKKPWSPEGKKASKNGEAHRDKPFLYNAESGYPDGRPWYLDDMVVNLAFASAIMFIIWLPNILFRAPKPTGRRVTKEMYRKQE